MANSLTEGVNQGLKNDTVVRISLSHPLANVVDLSNPVFALHFLNFLFIPPPLGISDSFGSRVKIPFVTITTNFNAFGDGERDGN